MKFPSVYLIVFEFCYCYPDCLQLSQQSITEDKPRRYIICTKETRSFVSRSTLTNEVPLTKTFLQFKTHPGSRRNPRLKMASNVSIDSTELLYSCYHLPNPHFEMAHNRYLSNLLTGVINALFAPFAVVANSLVFFAIFLNPSLRSPSTLLIACLALSDLLVSLIVQPTYVAYRFSEIRYGNVNCTTRLLYATEFYICYGVSFMTLSAISFDRYLALRLHLRYKGLVTAKRVLLVAILIWLLNIALTSLQWARINRIARGVHLFFWFTSLFIAAISQLRIHLIVRRHSRQIQQQQFHSSGNHKFRIQVKLAVSVAYIVGIYFLFNFPVLVVTALHQIVTGHMDSYDYYSWSETVAFLNSFVNPLICFWRSEEIRKAVWRLLRRGCCKKWIPENADDDSRT